LEIVMLTEEGLRRMIRRDIERISAPHDLRERLDARMRGPNRVRVRALALATAAVVVLLAGVGASMFAGTGEVRPGSAGRTSTQALPVPPDVHIVRPDRSVPRDAAAFSGVWAGTWDGVLPSRLIVERVTARSADVILVWGKGRDPNLKPGWLRVTAQVLSDGRITWGRNSPFSRLADACDAHRDPCSDVRFVFTLSHDRSSLSGGRQVYSAGGGFVNTVTMHRVKDLIQGIIRLAILGLMGLAVVALFFVTRRRRMRP
jgi:hypothetical protein